MTHTRSTLLDWSVQVFLGRKWKGDHLMRLLHHNCQDRLPSRYHVVKMALTDSWQYVINVRVKELDDVLALPVIRRNMTIYPNLHYRMHVAGTEVSVRKVIYYDTDILLSNILLSSTRHCYLIINYCVFVSGLQANCQVWHLCQHERGAQRLGSSEEHRP